MRVAERRRLQAGLGELGWMEQLLTLLLLLARCPGHSCEQAVPGEGGEGEPGCTASLQHLPFPCQAPGTAGLSWALFCSVSDPNAVWGWARLLPAWLTSGSHPCCCLGVLAQGAGLPKVVSGG